MEMITTIKVDKETEEIIKKFVRFCYNNNINEAEDIGDLAMAIEYKYHVAVMNNNNQTFNIMYEQFI